MVEVVGSDIKKLKRIRIENIELGDLAEGEWRKLTHIEKTELFRGIGVDKVEN
jgi:23S rRNA pseudouridine2604 synthase